MRYDSQVTSAEYCKYRTGKKISEPVLCFFFAHNDSDGPNL